MTASVPPLPSSTPRKPLQGVRVGVASYIEDAWQTAANRTTRQKRTGAGTAGIAPVLPAVMHPPCCKTCRLLGPCGFRTAAPQVAQPEPLVTAGTAGHRFTGSQAPCPVCLSTTHSSSVSTNLMPSGVPPCSSRSNKAEAQMIRADGGCGCRAPSRVFAQQAPSAFAQCGHQQPPMAGLPSLPPSFPNHSPPGC